jgi:hypothetical protein
MFVLQDRVGALQLQQSHVRHCSSVGGWYGNRGRKGAPRSGRRQFRRSPNVGKVTRHVGSDSHIRVEEGVRVQSVEVGQALSNLVMMLQHATNEQTERTQYKLIVISNSELG